MSFASETKNELSRIMPEKKCCMLAEIAGFLRFAGIIGLVGGGKYRVKMTTGNLATVRHYKKLIKEYFDVEISIEKSSENTFGGKSGYSLVVGPEERSEEILRETGVLMVKEGRNYFADGIYDDIIKTKCCRKAYLRGAFLAAGTLSNPEKAHHFEISAQTKNLAGDLERLINRFVDINANTVARRNRYGVYLKAREQICDMLAIMGAVNQQFRYVDAIMRKDLLAKVHRADNLDNANIDKALRAAQRQLDDIAKIENTCGPDFLPAKLKAVAEMRKANPEIGIEELGKMMNPPLTKSGVNNRLRRIAEIAKSL